MGKLQISSITAVCFLVFGACSNSNQDLRGEKNSSDSYLTTDSTVTTTNNCKADVCDVSKFSGESSQRINDAIKEAISKNIDTVYLPNGTYWLDEQIIIENPIVRLKIAGESKQGVVLAPRPILDNKNCLTSAINIDRSTGFDSLNLEITNLTINQQKAMKHPIFLNGGCSTGAHGIRVGNGWKSGKFIVRNVNILNPPGYGIGIGTIGSDLNADNVILRDILIKNAGMDGIDTKAPDSRINRNLKISNLSVNGIGLNDERSAAAVDISYQDFSLKNIKIKIKPKQENPRGLATNTGIRFRAGFRTALDGEIKGLHIKGSYLGVFFEGSYPNVNKNISIRNFIVEDYQRSGFTVRGEDIKISKGCVYSDTGKMEVNLDEDNLDQKSLSIDYIDNKGSCPRSLRLF